MAARYALRQSPLLDACHVAPAMFAPVMPRRYPFMQPCVSSCQGQAAAPHANTSVCGLWSNVEHKNIAAIA
jgi:hypothetical protein